MAGAIDWLRWLAYLAAGVPLFGWLFFTRNRVMRAVGLLVILFFISDTFAGRRYFFGFSLGPSLAAAYIALMAVALEQRRLPRLGVYGGLLLGLLFFALVGLVMSTDDLNSLQFGLKQLQFNFLEGFVFFLYAMSALGKGEDLRRFFWWFVPIGLACALVHIFSVGTGYRFRGGTEDTVDANFGGVLVNPNSLGSFYAMCVPVAFAMVMSPKTPFLWRRIAQVSLTVMAGSLVLSGSRGGMIFSLIGCGIAGIMAGLGVARVVIGLVGAAALGGIGFQVMKLLVGSKWALISADLEREGLDTNRWITFAGYGRAILKHPFGAGLTPTDFKAAVEAIGLYGVSSAHNIYLDMGLQLGVLGLLLFLALLWNVLSRNRRAARLTDDVPTREGLRYAFLALVGYCMVGFFEPVYLADTKMNNLFWLIAGLCAAGSNQVFEDRRRRHEAPGAAPKEIAFAGHAPTR